MHKANAQHSKTQDLLLVSKLLDCRETVSPFTLILDSLNQSGRPLIQEFVTRAQIARVKTIFVSFETLRPPAGISHFIQAHALDAASIQKEISNLLASEPSFRYIIVIDTLHPLLTHSIHLPSYLTGLLAQLPPAPSSVSKSTTVPSTSLIAIYHADQPVSNSTSSPYSPKPLTLLCHLATSVLTVHSPQHVLARRAAQDRAIAAPVFGLEESMPRYGHEAEGILQGLGANGKDSIIADGEIRRRSGRAVEVCFVLGWSPSAKNQRGPVKDGTKSILSSGRECGQIFLLNDHPLFKSKAMGEDVKEEDSELDSISFNLSLTEKQKRDREGVVLPHFDAQNESGEVGEGGRILYDMGVEDDFDEEEDEI